MTTGLYNILAYVCKQQFTVSSESTAGGLELDDFKGSLQPNPFHDKSVKQKYTSSLEFVGWKWRGKYLNAKPSSVILKITYQNVPRHSK